MKLKKIIASLTAAAMAVTTMAFAPLSVSAENVQISTSTTVIGEWDKSAEFEADCFADLTFDGSEYLAVTYYSQNELNQYYCAMKFATLNNYVALLEPQVPNVSVDGKITLLFPLTANYSVIATDGLQIQGYDLTITDVSVFYNVDTNSISKSTTVIGEWDKSAEFEADCFADLTFDGSEYLAVTYYSQNELNQYYCAMKFATLNNYVALLEPQVPNVSVDGKITLLFPLSDNYSAIAVDGFQIQGYDLTITDVSVIKPVANADIPVTSVNVTPSTAALVVGDTTTLTAEVLPADATDPSITWASSDEKVATVDKNGKVTAVAEGKATITATSNADSAIFGSCEVTVVSPEAEKYALNITKPENGTVAIKGDITEAFANETIELVITPDADYALDTVTVNGKTISGTSFTMPAEDVTITVTFKKIGSAGAEIVAPEGVSVSFAGSKEDILKAVFGDDYADLVAAGYKIDVVMTVKDETAVSAEDKALVEGALSNDMHIGLLIDVSLVMTKDGVSSVVANSSKPVSFAIGVPDSIIADGRTYSVIRVHDGAAEDIGGTYDAANKTITVSSDKYSTYAVVYKDAPAPQPEPTVTYYPITADRNVTASASSAAAGEQINVRVNFGYDAYVYCGGRVISKITENGSFTMPAGKVTIVTQANGYLVMIKNAAPNSYIFVYDTDMNYIKTNGSVKGIKGEGKVTVKLGEEYAGKTVTLYKGRKSTSVKLDSLTLDENGNATFTVEGGKNYTAVVE